MANGVRVRVRVRGAAGGAGGWWVLSQGFLVWQAPRLRAVVCAAETRASWQPGNVAKLVATGARPLVCTATCNWPPCSQPLHFLLAAGSHEGELSQWRCAVGLRVRTRRISSAVPLTRASVTIAFALAFAPLASNSAAAWTRVRTTCQTNNALGPTIAATPLSKRCRRYADPVRPGTAHSRDLRPLHPT